MASPVACGRSLFSCCAGRPSTWPSSCIASRFESTTVRRRHEMPGLYCATCHSTLFGQKDKQAQCRVPFRDAATLASVRGVAAPPRLVDQDEAWSQATADAARVNRQGGGVLSFSNLVPRPDPTRWQTTIEAPFQTMRSEEARAGALPMPALSETPPSGGDSRCSSRRLWSSCSRKTRAVSSL